MLHFRTLLFSSGDVEILSVPEKHVMLDESWTVLCISNPAYIYVNVTYGLQVHRQTLLLNNCNSLYQKDRNSLWHCCSRKETNASVVFTQSFIGWEFNPTTSTKIMSRLVQKPVHLSLIPVVYFMWLKEWFGLAKGYKCKNGLVDYYQ
jgi:hypothetical protein